MNECGLVSISRWPHFSFDRRKLKIPCVGVLQKQQNCECNTKSFRRREIFLRNNVVPDAKIELGLSEWKKLVALLKQKKKNDAASESEG